MCRYIHRKCARQTPVVHEMPSLGQLPEQISPFKTNLRYLSRRALHFSLSCMLKSSWELFLLKADFKVNLPGTGEGLMQVTTCALLLLFFNMPLVGDGKDSVWLSFPTCDEEVLLAVVPAC